MDLSNVTMEELHAEFTKRFHSWVFAGLNDLGNKSVENAFAHVGDFYHCLGLLSMLNKYIIDVANDDNKNALENQFGE